MFSWPSSRRDSIVAVVVAGLGIVGCSTRSPSCDSTRQYGVRLLVTTAVEDTLCDALVTLTDDSYVETLNSGPSEYGNCSYSGAAERSGNYVVKVIYKGVEKTTGPLRVERDECHVKPVTATIVFPAA